MRWADDGIYLNGRAFGETSVIADIFTKDHGRTFGLVKGGRSRKFRPLLQTGNGLKVEWRARLDEQLGVYTVELTKATAAEVLDDELSLAGVMVLASHLQILPERDPHPGLFEVARNYLAHAPTSRAPEHLVRFELRLLEELGFGLDFSACAATGSRDNLIYVSPKSGRAVSQAAGEPYRDKLLALPSFLAYDDWSTAPTRQDVIRGLELTDFFLKVHVYGQDGRTVSDKRARFYAMQLERGR